MYDDGPYNEAELDVIQHVEGDIENLENGRPPRRKQCVSRGESDGLDVNISTKNTGQKLGKLPLAILGKIYRDVHRIELSGNDLGTSGLPQQFDRCQALYYLKLAHCSLATVPNVVCRLQSLVILDVSHNHLDHIPSELQDLKSLRVLCLSHNRFRELPTFLLRVGSLKTIDLSENPLEAPPREVWDNTLPQNRGLSGLDGTKRILKWLAERAVQTPGTTELSTTEFSRPGSLVPRPLNLNKTQQPAQSTVVSSTIRSSKPNRNGSMDTTFSDAATDVQDIALAGNHAIYVAKRIGKAYFQLVQHVLAELSVVDTCGDSTNIRDDFLGLLRALEECARDLMSSDLHDGGIDRVKVATSCAHQLLSDTLRLFLEDVAVHADDDLLEDMPLLLEMVDKNIASALQDVGVRFAGGNTMDRVNSLFRIASQGTVGFSYTGQPQAGIVNVRVPELRVTYAPIETPEGTLSYANSAMSSTADLQQATKIEDEPYELIGDVIGNCASIWQELNALLANGHMQSVPPPIHRLWNDTLVAVQQLDQRAKVLHEHLENFSANEIATLREPCDMLVPAVVILRKLLNKLSKNSNLVSEKTMAAAKRIKESAATAMRLLNGTRSSAIPPAGTIAATGGGSSYAPATPFNAALGPAAARMMSKDTSSLFKKIEDFNRRERRF